ncbi:MAG: serine/threonine protein kinase, partial [Oligoflexales bacterium]|nr:serine/threonine protein kinase [Oligoflexales bacterium]
MKKLLKGGQRLCDGRYELRRPLGSGGFSETYEAYDHSYKPPRIVAIKWLLPGSFGQEQERLRDDFYHECVILEKIKHPGIIKILELGREEGLPYLVLEYLNGGTFQNRLSRSKTQSDMYDIDPIKLVDIAITLSDAMERFHSSGIIHGDIKPANIGFRELGDQQPVLFDFGHSRFFSFNEESARNETAASLPYMPPERIGFLNSTLKTSSDLYSFGITLYEIATGKMIFTGDSYQEICEKIL